MHKDMHSLASAVGFIPTNGDLKNLLINLQYRY